MADFGICLSWTLKFEDPEGEYKKLPDVGGYAIAGVNSYAFPSEFAVISDAAPEDRPLLVESFYRNRFWNKWLEQINSNEVAKRVFDAGVNMGAGTAVKIAQEAAGLGGNEMDGAWGPNTATAINTEGDAMIDLFKQCRSDHYRKIVEKNPKMSKYLNGWLARANA